MEKKLLKKAEIKLFLTSFKKLMQQKSDMMQDLHSKTVLQLLFPSLDQE